MARALMSGERKKKPCARAYNNFCDTILLYRASRSWRVSGVPVVVAGAVEKKKN
jgi:hypothetical protein